MTELSSAEYEFRQLSDRAAGCVTPQLMLPTPLMRQEIPLSDPVREVQPLQVKLCERTPRVCSTIRNAKGGYVEETRIEDMFSVIFTPNSIHNFDGFSENLQCE